MLLDGSPNFAAAEKESYNALVRCLAPKTFLERCNRYLQYLWESIFQNENAIYNPDVLFPFSVNECFSWMGLRKNKVAIYSLGPNFWKKCSTCTIFDIFLADIRSSISFYAVKLYRDDGIIYNKSHQKVEHLLNK